MKSKRILNYNELVSNSQELLTMFTFQPIEFKKRLESLIERNYIKRNETDTNIFTYIP